MREYTNQSLSVFQQMNSWPMYNSCCGLEPVSINAAN
jgi:hypothetical protein